MGWIGIFGLLLLYISSSFFDAYSSQDGQTPLFFASEKGYSAIVDTLLKNKADPNIAQNVSNCSVCFVYMQW